MPSKLPFEPVVATFARHGYRKTAMGDVATALGVSRQLLYNRFGSKQALADWAQESLIDASLSAALAAVEQPSKTLADRLADALDQWVGRHMDALNLSPSGADAVPMLRRESDAMTRAAERRLIAAMTDAIRLSGPGAAVARAGSMAQALCWTARGLVHAVPDHATFRRQIDHILGALVAR
jgi:AcrR family transcriptional regulator